MKVALKKNIKHHLDSKEFSIMPDPKESLEKRLAKSEDDIANGRTISHSEVKSRVEAWSQKT